MTWCVSNRELRETGLSIISKVYHLKFILKLNRVKEKEREKSARESTPVSKDLYFRKCNFKVKSTFGKCGFKEMQK